MLFDRFYDNYIIFKNLQEFEDYFISEVCQNSNEKPFLINECASFRPSIKNIPSKFAYKIGVVHSNPYTAPYGYGAERWYLASLEDYKFEDAVVVLTESAKKILLRNLILKILL